MNDKIQAALQNLDTNKSKWVSIRFEIMKNEEELLRIFNIEDRGIPVTNASRASWILNHKRDGYYLTLKFVDHIEDKRLNRFNYTRSNRVNSTGFTMYIKKDGWTIVQIESGINGEPEFLILKEGTNNLQPIDGVILDE